MAPVIGPLAGSIKAAEAGQPVYRIAIQTVLKGR